MNTWHPTSWDCPWAEFPHTFKLCAVSIHNPQQRTSYLTNTRADESWWWEGQITEIKNWDHGFLHVALCNLVDEYPHFSETRCFLLQGRRKCSSKFLRNLYLPDNMSWCVHDILWPISAGTSFSKQIHIQSILSFPWILQDTTLTGYRQENFGREVWWPWNFG
jgi:hypothetical protein